jgi:hypothetical protein
MPIADDVAAELASGPRFGKEYRAALHTRDYEDWCQFNRVDPYPTTTERLITYLHAFDSHWSADTRRNISISIRHRNVALGRRETRGWSALRPGPGAPGR